MTKKCKKWKKRPTTNEQINLKIYTLENKNEHKKKQSKITKKKKLKNPSSWPKLDQPTTTTIEKPTVENTEQSGKSCLINIYKKNIFITITRQVKCMNENKNEYSRYISLEINSKIKWRKQSTSYNTHHPCPCDPVLLFFLYWTKKTFLI